jgi:hypothetical protein
MGVLQGQEICPRRYDRAAALRERWQGKPDPSTEIRAMSCYSPATQHLLGVFYLAAGIALHFDGEGRLAGVTPAVDDWDVPGGRPTTIRGEVMSERVTWEDCPRCGGPAAVGWAAAAEGVARSARELPVEFDCAGGCRLTPAELRLLGRHRDR